MALSCMLASVKLRRMQMIMGITTKPTKKIKLGRRKRYAETASRRTSSLLLVVWVFFAKTIAPLEKISE